MNPRRRTKKTPAVTLLLCVMGLGPLLSPSAASAQQPAGVPQRPPPGAPVFEFDPSWPDVPEGWVLGEVSSIGVDSQNRLLVLHRPRSVPAEEQGLAAPPILEFDVDGNFLRAWGGAGDGFEWPEREHAIHVDHQDNVWIGGNNCPERNLPGLRPVGDDQLVKFSRDGRFLLQIGRSGQSGGNADTRNVRQPGDQAVYAPTNEIFVADGYGNRRLIVFDADTGEFKRMWGAFGNEPADSYSCPPAGVPAPSDGVGPPQFNIVHALSISNDGLVYAADREYRRVQVFTVGGEFVDQVLMPGNARAGDVALSSDPQQAFLYVPAGGQILVFDRRSLDILYSFPGSGHHIATDLEGNLYTAETGQRRTRKFAFRGLAGEQAQAPRETIAIIGTGNVGSTLGKVWARAGHTVIYGSRTPDDGRVRALVSETGYGATATSQAAAAARAEIVVIPVPPTAIPEVIGALGDLTGKIVLDPTNSWSFENGYPISPRDPRESLAEEVQALAPGASVVKALNTLNFIIMEDPTRAGGPVTIPIVGDDPAAKERVARLVEDVGLEPLDVGPLLAAEYLEEMLRLALGFRELNPGTAFDYYLRVRPN